MLNTESFGITEDARICENQGGKRIGMTSTGKAFSPCQITGFFKIHVFANDPLRTGSTGAGINLRRGVTTSVRISRSTRSKIKILKNGRPLPNPVVSLEVIREHLGRSLRKAQVLVSHETILPMGCGYGTSGAGALSLSLALNEALGSNLTEIEAAQIAHKAEVKNRTGLGTVSSAFYGGHLVRMTPGAPGFAEVRKMTPPSSLRVVSGSFGPISTKGVLSSPSLRRRINHCGKGLTSLHLRSPETGTFLKLSHRFAKCLGLASPRLLETISKMHRRMLMSSMMMIGESIFTLVQEDRVHEARAILRKAGLSPVVSRVSSRGAMLL